MNAFDFPKVRTERRDDHLLGDLKVHRIHRLPDPDYAGDIARITIYFDAKSSSWLWCGWLKRTGSGDSLIIGPSTSQRFDYEFYAQLSARNALRQRAPQDSGILNWLGGGGFMTTPRSLPCRASPVARLT